MSEEATPAGRISEETGEANRSRPNRHGRDRSRSPRAQRLDRFPIRSRSRSLRAPDLNDSDRDFHPVQQRPSSSGGRSSHEDDNANRTLADDTQENDGYCPDDDGYMPESSEFAGQVEAEGSSQIIPALPSPRYATDRRTLLSQALATDEIAQVHREVDGLSKKLRASETERDRLIEKVKTQQAETHKVFKQRHVEAIHELKATYEKQLQASRSENTKAIAALKSEHAATTTAQQHLIDELRAQTVNISEHLTRLDNKQSETEHQVKEQAGLIKTLQEENERLKQSAQALSAQMGEPEPTPTPVEESDQPDDSAQQTESLASVMARMPEGVQLPRVQARYRIRVTPPFAGSILERNNNIPNEPGWRHDFI